jgi:hypothetical protein
MAEKVREVLPLVSAGAIRQDPVDAMGDAVAQ